MSTMLSKLDLYGSLSPPTTAPPAHDINTCADLVAYDSTGKAVGKKALPQWAVVHPQAAGEASVLYPSCGCEELVCTDPAEGTIRFDVEVYSRDEGHDGSIITDAGYNSATVYTYSQVGGPVAGGKVSISVPLSDEIILKAAPPF